ERRGFELVERRAVDFAPHRDAGKSATSYDRDSHVRYFRAPRVRAGASGILGTPAAAAGIVNVGFAIFSRGPAARTAAELLTPTALHASTTARCAALPAPS